MEKLEQFFKDRGSSDSTRRHYIAAVNHYTALQNKSLDELIQEADFEEEKGIRWKNRKLKERLINFRNHLFENKMESSAKLYFNDIKSIYRHFEIEMQSLPNYSRQVNKSYTMTYDDLPSKSELIDVYYEANKVVKCILLFGMSSGISRIDMLNMTVNDFITGCEDYITTFSLVEQLNELKNEAYVIPTFKGKRQKNNKSFTTFCSPEAVTHIIQYLLGRDAEIKQVYNEADDEDKKFLPKQLELSDKLFGISETHLDYSFRKMNAKLNIAKVGSRTKIRCHMLRKWQASMLLNAENGFTIDEVDALQGRSKDMTHRSYFFNDVSKLYQKYVECVDELMLFQSIHEIDKNDYERLEKENLNYKNKIQEQDKKMEEIIETQKKLEMLLRIE